MLEQLSYPSTTVLSGNRDHKQLQVGYKIYANNWEMTSALLTGERSAGNTPVPEGNRIIRQPLLLQLASFPLQHGGHPAATSQNQQQTLGGRNVNLTQKNSSTES